MTGVGYQLERAVEKLINLSPWAIYATRRYTSLYVTTHYVQLLKLCAWGTDNAYRGRQLG
jgi:hypothetical protein